MPTRKTAVSKRRPVLVQTSYLQNLAKDKSSHTEHPRNNAAGQVKLNKAILLDINDKTKENICFFEKLTKGEVCTKNIAMKRS